MKDYYEILGLEEDASQEEIRERWLELTKLYHRDVLKSPQADEKIKEINEAYQVLKDFSSRLEYDLQRALQRSVLKKVVEKEEKKSPWPKVMLPTGIFIAVAFMIFYVLIKFPTRYEQPVKMPTPEQAKTKEIIPPPVQMAELEKRKIPEKAIASMPIPEEVKPTSPEKKMAPQKTEPAKQLEKQPTLAKVVIKEETKEPAKAEIIAPFEAPEPTKIITPEKPQIQPPKLEPAEKPVELAKPKEIEKPILSEKAKVAPPQTPKEPEKVEAPEKLEKPMEVAKAPAAEAVKSPIPQAPDLKQGEKPEKLEKVKEPLAPVEMVKDIKAEPTKVIQPEEPKIIEAKKLEKIEIPEKPMPAKEEEVRKFLAGYISTYKQKDIEGFLSYFSAQAIQNQKYNFGEIKKIYKTFFDRSQELNYNLKDIQTTDHSQGLEVRAKYELHQVTKKDGEKKSWKGQIRWILVRENGRLKIISLDYQHQK